MSVEYLIFVDFISIFQAHTQGKRIYLVAPKNYFGSGMPIMQEGGWKNQLKNALIWQN